MKLLTKELEKRFAKVGRQEEDSIVIAKFFNPVGAGTWYATEYDPERRVFFGYVSIFGDWNDELGDFSLDELEALDLPLGMHIERDLYWTECPLQDVMDRKVR